MLFGVGGVNQRFSQVTETEHSVNSSKFCFLFYRNSILQQIFIENKSTLMSVVRN